MRVLSGATSSEHERREYIADLVRNSPIPNSELLYNLGLYMPRQALSRIMFVMELYPKILETHGVIMEFGVRWGQNMSLFQSLRGIYEPFNYNRKIIGFDTFSGFPGVDRHDGGKVTTGDYGVVEGYRETLETLLATMEQDSPIPQLRKFELVEGDATVTIQDYLKRQPETIVALAYFDFDIYAPTKACLEAIRPHLTKGSILAFDELNTPEFPGETIALKEVLGLDTYRIRRLPYNPLTSYIVIE